MKTLTYDHINNPFILRMGNYNIIEHDYSKDYFTLETVNGENFTDLTFKVPSQVTSTDVASISYSIDNGNSWTTVENESGITISINNVNKVLFKGDAKQFTTASDNYGNNSSHFETRHLINVYGNIMSLFYGDDFTDKTEFPEGSSKNLLRFFNTNYQGWQLSCPIREAKNLILPATTLTSKCYESLFCYNPYLISTPKLPATTLAESCYGYMFGSCYGLTKAPELPATTLANYCYSSMFTDCHSLTKAPELPATTLASNCYNSMFESCYSLTKAPELPATTLASNCYSNMFKACKSLKYIKMMATTNVSENNLDTWTRYVYPIGTFVKNSAAEWDITGWSGVPDNWTVVTADA